MTMRTAIAIVTALFVSTVSAFAAEPPRSIPVEESGGFSHVDGSGPYRLATEMVRHHRNSKRALTASSPVSEDVGNVAVIVDNGSIIIPPRPGRPFDLPSPSKLALTPTSTGFSVAFAAPGLDPSTGGPLPLGDDDQIEVSIPFTFPFLGHGYSSIWVNSDGNVTLGSGDGATGARDAARLIGGPPRIAAFLQDMDVTAGGSIRADARSDRVVVTWTDVPEFATTLLNTFQITLFASGRVELGYGRMSSPFGVTGVAEGNNEGPITEVDYTADLPLTLPAGAIFEEFLPPVVMRQMDVVALAREFYRTHPDHFDFLVMFSDGPIDIGGGAFAFEVNISNNTSGLNLGNFDFTSFVGSGGELESILNMNNVGLYWPDINKLVDPPIDKFRFFGGATFFGPPGKQQFSIRARTMGTLNGDFLAHGSYSLGLNSAMSVMGQESMHRWGAFVPFVHPTKGIGFDSFDLLGRDFAHWSFFFNVRTPANYFAGDPRASNMEGNAIIDFGGPAFGFCTAAGQHAFQTERNELIDGFTELDQYLMGIRRASEVSPFWYVDEPIFAGGESAESFRGVDAVDDIFFCGKRVDLTVANIQAFPGIGPRSPAIGDEDDDGRGNDVKTMAFILLVDGNSSHASAISQVDNFRRTWQQYVNGPATGGRGKFDTSLRPVIH